MKTMTVGEFKTNFSNALKEVEGGEQIAITYGRNKVIKAILVPNQQNVQKRKLGIWVGKASFFIKEDFKISEIEFLAL